MIKRFLKVFVALFFLCIFTPILCGEETPAVRNILSSAGDQILDGTKPFRFISFNIPNLHLIEDNFSFLDSNPWRWPNEFEIADALESVRQMGGTVVRTYVLSVHREGSDMGDCVHVRAPGDFNETAFRVLDKVLQIAGEKGIRVIIPLVDNWRWWGGAAEYAQFRNKSLDAFWTDEQVIRDFEETVRFTLSRVNTNTGITYKDDPVIFGWETGNELNSTPEWTRRIASLIKQLDPNHLVIDGFSLHGVRPESVDDPNIDVITTHHYPKKNGSFVKSILEARALTKGKKPYFVGEFGFVPAKEIEQVLETVIDSGISGALLWSLRFHNRDGGFYWHDEPAGGNHFKAYHWPGFPSGDGYEETVVLDLVRQSAYRIRGLTPPPIAPPAKPYLLPIEHPGRISWQGSAGASSYEIESAENKSGPWKLVGRDISDAAVQYRPLFSDTTIRQGQQYYYRVIALNSDGRSEPSNVVGPVKSSHLLLVDEMQETAPLFHATNGEVKHSSDKSRKVQEDIHRVELGPQANVVYQLPGHIKSICVYTFSESADIPCEIAISQTGESFEPIAVERVAGRSDQGMYDYLQPILIESELRGKNAQFVRILNSAFDSDPSNTSDSRFQISRVEIAYDQHELLSKE